MSATFAPTATSVGLLLTVPPMDVQSDQVSPVFVRAQTLSSAVRTATTVPLVDVAAPGRP